MTMVKRRRLLYQIFPTYLIITVLSLIAVTWLASRSFKQFYLNQSALDLEARAHLFESQILAYLSPLDERKVDELCKKIGNRATTRITVILPSGRVIGDSQEDPKEMDYHNDRPEIVQALSEDRGISTRYSRTLNTDLMYMALPLKENNRIVGLIRTAIPLTSIDTVMKSFQRKMLWGGILVTALVAIISLWVSGRITQPIEEIKKSAELFSRGNFKTRLPLSTTEEVNALSETMNNMAKEILTRINMITRQRNELSAVLSSMVEGVFAVDESEHIISMNQAAGDILKVTPTRVQGRSIQEVIRHTDIHKFAALALASKNPVEEDVVLLSDNERMLNMHGTPLLDEKENRIGVLIVLNDMTRLMKLENMRSEFVANVSHEIKTPITAIKGFVETLSSGSVDSDDDQKRFLEIIGKHVDRLDHIIDDLLSLSRIEREAKARELVFNEHSLINIFQVACQVCRPKAEFKNIQIEISCEEGLKWKMNPPLMEQALVNLLDNAIKYSNNNSKVNLEARNVSGELIISVSDWGCGIEKEHLPRLFERFYRVDKARSRKLGGTGLGLAIVKHIVQSHGGFIDVDSTPGKGTSFHLHLPS